MHRLSALVLALVATACVPELAPVDDPDTGAYAGPDQDDASDDKEPAQGQQGGDDDEDVCAWADELGDAIEDAPNLGMIDTPGAICGELDEAGNDGGGYAGDLDFVAFQVGWDATYHLSLAWTASEADYDLYVFEITDEGYETVSDSYIEGTEYESITLRLEAGATYVAGIAGWDGGAGEWTLTVE